MANKASHLEVGTFRINNGILLPDSLISNERVVQSLECHSPKPSDMITLSVGDGNQRRDNLCTFTHIEFNGTAYSIRFYYEFGHKWDNGVLKSWRVSIKY